MTNSGSISGDEGNNKQSKLRKFVLDAYGQLLSRHGGVNAVALHVLTVWLAVARLHCAAGSSHTSLLDLVRVEDLGENRFWKILNSRAVTVLERECSSGAFSKDKLPDLAAFLVKVSVLIQCIGLDWTGIDQIIVELKLSGDRHNSDELIDERVVALLFDALGAEAGSKVWLPFDKNGQLLCEAVSRHLVPIGYPQLLDKAPLNVNTSFSSFYVLMLALVGDAATILSPEGLLGERSPLWLNDRPAYAVIATPRDFSIERNLSSYQAPDTWRLSSDITSSLPTEVDAKKGDAASVAAFLPLIEKKAIFLASPKLLFSKGKEHRFRTAVVNLGIPLAHVIQLPKGTYNRSNFAGAILVFDKSRRYRQVQLVDCSDASDEGRVFIELSAHFIAGLHSSDLIHRQRISQNSVTRTIVVSPDEIRTNDYSWLPTRLLLQVENKGSESIALESVVDIIRPAPILKQSSSAVSCVEIGIPQLGRYYPISEPSEKYGLIEPSKIGNYRLVTGDILLSTKGTVGKCGLLDFNQMEGQLIAVSSNSCVGLRVKPGLDITPQALLMYLISPDGREQIKRLTVGATVAALPLESIRQIKVPRDFFIGGKRGEEYLLAFNELKELEAARLEIDKRIATVERRIFDDFCSKL